MNDIPTAQAAMQFIGEDPTGRQWYFADNSFSKPGIYFWDGANNIHVQELIEYQARELTTTREQLLESESARNRNFQSASEALETVTKLSAELEATEKERDEVKEIARDRDARVEQTQEWVVAKLVEALEAMHRGSLQNGNTRESNDIIWAGHKASKEARAIAAPFLVKGESKV